MKTTRILILVLAIATFFFTSCEKDSFEETTGITETTTSESQVSGEDFTPAEAAPTHEDTDVQEFQKEMILQLPALDTTQTLILQSGEEAVTSRSSYSLNVYNGISSVTCGSNVNGSVYGHTNKISDAVYSHFGLSSNLNGSDFIYLFNVQNAMTVEFELSNTNQNLAMVLFKTNVALASTFYHLSLTDVKAYSTSTSIYGDNIGSIHLTPGFYALVIDSRYGYPSNFKLKVACASSTTSGCIPYTTGLKFDDFSNYSIGTISAQSASWNKWNPSASYDGEVVFASNSSSKLLRVERKNTTTANQPDVLWKFGTRNSGHYAISMKMWVYSYKSAYFNIQKNLTNNNQSNEFGGQVYFYSNGTGVVNIAGQNYGFSYGQNKWMDIKIDVNFYTNQTKLIIDGVTKATWPCTWWSNGYNGSSQIEAIDFYPYASNSQFFLSKVCLSKY